MEPKALESRRSLLPPSAPNAYRHSHSNQTQRVKMGKKAKSSRKGKKAWRANISTTEIEDFFEKSTKDALSGGSLTQLPSESLFYVDKSKDLSVRRKIEKHRERVLRSDSVLQKNPFVQAVPSSLKKAKHDKKLVSKPSGAAASHVTKKDSVTVSGMVDMWADEEEGDNKHIKRTIKTTPIPAVEVEHPGCSFNPPHESHQDVLAKAVAEEMQKVYKKELGPQPVPLIVSAERITEEDMYFLDADDGSDDDTNVENDNGENALDERSVKKIKMVTRVELNKRGRRKERQRIEAEGKKKEGVLKEIDSLPDILQEIAEEDEEKQKRHIRRAVAKEERLKARPPRLGKHKFKPAPQQVLLTEEITGSLRKLKACCTLARDRFNSFEKRGLLPPTGKTGKK